MFATLRPSITAGRLSGRDNESIRAASKKVDVKDPAEDLGDLQHAPKLSALK